MERNRTSIPIRGIDRAASDDTVPDGACEDMLNLRYRAGSFETVCEPRLLHPVQDWAGFSVVIRLDDMPEDEYVARHGNEVCRVRLAAGSVAEQEKIMTLPEGAAEVGYSRFGRMLYVNYMLGGELQEEVYYYKDGRFSRVDFSAVAPPEMKISCEYKSAAKESFGSSHDLNKPEGVRIAYILRYPDDPGKNETTFYYNVGVEALTEEGYITGTAYAFAAYKLFDGSVIKPGGLQIITADGEEGSDQKLYDASYRYEDHDSLNYFGRVSGVKPTVRIVIPENIRNYDLIERVVIYATRNIPTYNFDRVHLDFGKKGFPAADIYANAPNNPLPVYECSHGCIWNEELDEISGPFYEIADVDFRNGHDTVTLTYEKHFKNIEHFPVYTPNYSCHNTISRGKYEYNDRLHIFDLKTELFKDAKAFILPDEIGAGNDNYECFAEYTLQADGETRIVRSREPGHAWTGDQSQMHFLNNLLSYPDSRANKVDVWVREKGPDGVFKTKKHGQYKLKSSPAINFSYALIEWKGNYLPSQSLCPGFAGGEPVNDRNDVIVSRNKIQVSYLSNPFVYAPANIYTVGGSGERIRQIIATAERMTEAVYGYQPLLVFTDRTVYALESGEGEVLYARNIPILSRTILEGTNAVEGDGAVFFVSTSGVTAIVRGRITAISEAMKRYAGLCPQDDTLPDFDAYIRSARLMFNRKESELIVYNPAHDYAYIYSLAGQGWTRRSWDGAVEPYFDEVVTPDGVASLSEEDPARPVGECRLVTRPLKLGSFEYKRLETLVARMRCGGKTSFDLSIEGSDDAVHWTVLRSESDVPAIRRTPSSFRYHRVVLVGSVGDYLSITHLDVEFYNRFVRRLR